MDEVASEENVLAMPATEPDKPVTRVRLVFPVAAIRHVFPRFL